MTTKLDSKTIKYRFSILRPGGNDTVLIKGLVKNPAKKKLINDQMMSLYPNVEQVGFYEFNPKTNIATLEMAGGEFCGNALRSLAFLVLNGKKGTISAKVSGVKTRLKTGVIKTNEVYAQMPILNSLDSVQDLDANSSLVTLEGISHLITKRPKNLNKEELKDFGKKLLTKANLLTSVPASGVMFISQTNKTLTLDPIVWVRDIQTLFYETACASGTAAIGLWQSSKSKTDQTELRIKQPSGYYINVSVKRNKNSFIGAKIWGKVELINQQNIELEVQRL